MAVHYTLIEITQAGYDDLFGNSHSEIVGEESDIDFDGLENKNSVSENGESDSESEQEDKAMLEWTNDLSHITVDDKLTFSTSYLEKTLWLTLSPNQTGMLVNSWQSEMSNLRNEHTYTLFKLEFKSTVNTSV